MRQPISNIYGIIGVPPLDVGAKLFLVEFVVLAHQNMPIPHKDVRVHDFEVKLTHDVPSCDLLAARTYSLRVVHQPDQDPLSVFPYHAGEWEGIWEKRKMATGDEADQVVATGRFHLSLDDARRDALDRLIAPEDLVA